MMAGSGESPAISNNHVETHVLFCLVVAFLLDYLEVGFGWFWGT